MNSINSDGKEPAQSGLGAAFVQMLSQHSMSRSLTIYVENSVIGDGCFKSAVAEALELYAQAIRTGVKGDSAEESFATPNGTVLKIKALA